MARKKYEFRPDRLEASPLKKIHITPKQRKALLKWSLYGVFLVLLSVVQDVILTRFRYYGASTELIPCAIMLICILEGADGGSVFALVASTVYVFSGAAPGAYSILLITVLGLVAAMFRQGFLRRGFGATWLCLCAAIMLYEALVFAVVLFLGQVSPARWYIFPLTGLLTLCVVPLLYPIARAIEKIGGDTWKD